MELGIYYKRSLAMNFFRKHYSSRKRIDCFSLIHLIINPKKELGWIAKSANKIFFSKEINKEIEINDLNGCKIIAPDSLFLFKGKIFFYKNNKTTKDYSIVFIKIVHSIAFAEQLYPNETFRFCVVKNKQNQIINCAWVSTKHHITIFQSEPDYDENEVIFEPKAMNEEFQFLNKKWYTCTEKGKWIVAELSM